jgi:hypothetical protein
MAIVHLHLLHQNLQAWDALRRTRLLPRRSNVAAGSGGGCRRLAMLCLLLAEVPKRCVSHVQWDGPLAHRA